MCFVEAQVCERNAEDCDINFAVQSHRNQKISGKSGGYRKTLGLSFLFCRCFTEGSSLLVYLGGLCARGGLKPKARARPLQVGSPLVLVKFHEGAGFCFFEIRAAL